MRPQPARKPQKPPEIPASQKATRTSISQLLNSTKVTEDDDDNIETEWDRKFKSRGAASASSSESTNTDPGFRDSSSEDVQSFLQVLNIFKFPAFSCSCQNVSSFLLILWTTAHAKPKQSVRRSDL
jgi:hypothetical protein